MPVRILRPDRYSRSKPRVSSVWPIVGSNASPVATPPTPRASLCLGHRFDDRVVERVGALGRAGHEVAFRALAADDLTGEMLDPRAGVAGQALGDAGGRDPAVLDHDRRLDVA